jgi:hypothetical protein
MKYQGNYCHAERSLDGLVSITYPDGLRCEAEWNKNEPQTDIRHPMIKECVKEGLCRLKSCFISNKLGTNTLPLKMHQKMGGCIRFYCETCWTYCHNEGPGKPRWIKRAECECNQCARMSKKQKN